MAEGDHETIFHKNQKARHKICDARIRTEVLQCFGILKHIINDNEERVKRSRFQSTQIQILEKTKNYIHNIHNIMEILLMEKERNNVAAGCYPTPIEHHLDGYKIDFVTKMNALNGRNAPICIDLNVDSGIQDERHSKRTKTTGKLFDISSSSSIRQLPSPFQIIREKATDSEELSFQAEDSSYPEFSANVKLHGIIDLDNESNEVPTKSSLDDRDPFLENVGRDFEYFDCLSTTEKILSEINDQISTARGQTGYETTPVKENKERHRSKPPGPKPDIDAISETPKRKQPDYQCKRKLENFYSLQEVPPKVYVTDDLNRKSAFNFRTCKVKQSYSHHSLSPGDLDELVQCCDDLEDGSGVEGVYAESRREPGVEWVDHQSDVGFERSVVTDPTNWQWFDEIGNKCDPAGIVPEMNFVPNVADEQQECQLVPIDFNYNDSSRSTPELPSQTVPEINPFSLPELASLDSSPSQQLPVASPPIISTPTSPALSGESGGRRLDNVYRTLKKKWSGENPLLTSIHSPLKDSPPSMSIGFRRKPGGYDVQLHYEPSPVRLIPLFADLE